MFIVLIPRLKDKESAQKLIVRKNLVPKKTFGQKKFLTQNFVTKNLLVLKYFGHKTNLVILGLEKVFGPKKFLYKGAARLV